MSKIVKKMKIMQPGGTLSDYVPIGAEAENINVDGESVETKLGKKPYYYDTVADMKADTKLKVGDMAVTLGYYSVNDGGGAEYRIVNTASQTEYQEIIGNLFATLIAKDYVTPEMFGAHGDGVQDDTSAFQLAINSGYVIKPTKKYYFESSLVDNEEKNLTIEGDGKTKFINFYLIKNLNPENDYKWVYPYKTKLTVKGINFTTNREVIFSTGSQTKIENCDFSNVNTIVATAYHAYLDTMIFKNVTISEYRTISNLTNYYIGSYIDNGTIGSTYLGDLYSFENVHLTAGSNGQVNHGRIFANFYGQETVVFNNCLNIRAKFLQANGIFIGCHFEDVSGIKDEWVTQSELTFISCSFFSDSFFVSNAKYIGCICTCHPVSGRFYNSPDVSFEQNDIPEDVDILINIESGRIGNPIPRNKEGGIGNENIYNIISDPSDITADAQLLNGEYTYTFNYSPVKTIRAGRNVDITKTYTTDGTKLPLFNLQNDYLKYMYGYVTRTDENNNTVWAMIPPRKVSRYIDYGNHINGSKWNSTTPPEAIIEQANVYGFKNGIVFSKVKIGYYQLGLVNQYTTSDKEKITII